MKKFSKDALDAIRQMLESEQLEVLEGKQNIEVLRGMADGESLQQTVARVGVNKVRVQNVRYYWLAKIRTIIGKDTWKPKTERPKPFPEGYLMTSQVAARLGVDKDRIHTILRIADTVGLPRPIPHGIGLAWSPAVVEAWRSYMEK